MYEKHKQVEEFKQAALDTLSKLAVYTELARRIHSNVIEMHKKLDERIDLGYDPWHRSSKRYIRIDRSIKFPEWFSFIFGADMENKVWNVVMSDYEVSTRLGDGTELPLSTNYLRVGHIIAHSFLDDYTWKRIMKNANKLDDGARKVLEYVFEMRSALREVLNKEEEIKVDYNALLHKYELDERFVNFISYSIDFIFSDVDWASFVTKDGESIGSLRSSVLNRELRLLPDIITNYPKGKRQCDREVNISLEAFGNKSEIIERVTKIEIEGISIVLGIKMITPHPQFAPEVLYLINSNGTTSVKNLILAHYLLTDEDWQWIYDTMVHYVGVSEVAKKKINEAYTIIKMAS
ncbi:MAG: hypothetical protein JHC26_01845 [Thermofilum sp.]|jgi:hypothetical protein|uniref:hypothetical protein n=1 Tax=Thermofilum sp. TaxID=1961369 RepID=UPI00258FD0DA|nr:hypothetical protein [Thermofilum sp.]MCI4407805.1 hypothetical protein [Thermofilum sp.]